MTGRVLGTVTQAAETLGTDSAGVWELVAAGELRADEQDEHGRWIIEETR